MGNYLVGVIVAGVLGVDDEGVACRHHPHHTHCHAHIVCLNATLAQTVEGPVGHEHACSGSTDTMRSAYGSTSKPMVATMPMRNRCQMFGLTRRVLSHLQRMLLEGTRSDTMIVCTQGASENLTAAILTSSYPCKTTDLAGQHTVKVSTAAQTL